jgi:hypothetical protein
VEKVITNPGRLKRPTPKYGQNSKPLNYDEYLIQGDAVLSLKARSLAFAIFMYFFIENSTLGLLPSQFYTIYRSVRISDLILYGLVIYSLFCIKEYIDLFKSKAFLIVKVLLLYLLFEFAISALRYKFNVIEYFFRLKGPWSSFMILPYLLLLKRNGFSFLVRLVFPVAIVSNILYILTALTGIAFLPGVMIISQELPGNLVVYRVYGGTFFGDTFFLGFIYFWITKRFRWYHLIFAVVFIVPHILAFGRSAWAYFIFVILLMLLFNMLHKRNFKILFKQAFIIAILGIATIYAFIKFIPDSDYYIKALNARIFQGETDIKYNEGTYGTRVLLANNLLVELWLKNDILIGIGMHPMWVYQAETREEQSYYSSFSDVTWPSVLAAYGAIGFGLAVIFQIYYLRTTYRLIRRSRVMNILTFFTILTFAEMLFDTFIKFSYSFISFGLWGIAGVLSFHLAAVIYYYEIQKIQPEQKIPTDEFSKPYRLYGRYYNSKYKTYKLRD